MPNSGTVTAGSVALASQYNNLRADVLDASTGHVHDGSADGGKQIEGTVIKSTGATSGYVLTAGAGGTTTTWAAPTAGGYNTVSATATWSAYSTATVGSQLYNSGRVAEWTVGGGGTVLYAMNVDVSTSNRVLHYWNLTNTAGTFSPAGSATATPITAGTVRKSTIAGKGFAAGSGVVFYEQIAATTSGSVSATLRRYSGDLVTNSWNTTIYSAAVVATNDPGQWIKTAFRNTKPIWANDVNMWLGFDARTGGGTSFVYAVNDTTGTLYTSAWGTYTSSTNRPNDAHWIAYVPGTAANTGTAHVFVNRITATNTYVYARISYELGTASITAVSTATATSGYPLLNAARSDSSLNGLEVPCYGWWDSALNQYVLVTSTQDMTKSMVGFDRTMGTVLWRSSYNNTTNRSTPSDTVQGDAGLYDPTRRLFAFNAGRAEVYALGSAGAFYNPMRPFYYLSNSNSGYDGNAVMMGAGSATHFLYRANNGSAVQSIPFDPFYTTVTIPAASNGRILIADDSPNIIGNRYATIAATSAVPLNTIFGDLTSTTLGVGALAPAFPIYLPANETLKLHLTTSTGDWRTSSFTSYDNFNAGTQVFTFRTIGLA
jgi:hypothetical protein